MKRKETLFEQKLIKNGWKLDHKTYCGKHSQKVNHYVYQKTYEIDKEKVFVANCVLDKSRNVVLDIEIENTLHQFISTIDLLLLKGEHELVHKEIDRYFESKYQENDKEIVETLEAIEECE